MSGMTTITCGARVVVTLRDVCDADRPHNPIEDGMRGTVTGDGRPGDHSLFVLFGGRVRPPRRWQPGDTIVLLPLGRSFRPDELEEIGALA